MDIGKKLKTLRLQTGYSQTELAKILDVSQRNISYYESTEELSGLLDYIFRICSLMNITVSEFFINEIDELQKKIPDYIKPDDAALFKIINTTVDPEIQAEIKKAFIHIVRSILLKKSDKLKNLPEYRVLFKE
jgi:transcriptional regulator with XRE-family HTH domain